MPARPAALPGFSTNDLLARGVAPCLLGPAGVRVFGEVVQALAPRTGEEAPAMELAAYSSMAMSPAGVSVPVPPPSVLALLGLHDPCKVAARVPEDEALAFTLALVACAVATNVLAAFLVAPLLAF